MRREDRTAIIILFLFLLIILGVGGILSFSGEVEFLGIGIKIPFLKNLFSNDEDSINFTTDGPKIIRLNPIKDISIKEIKTRKNIFYPGEEVFIDFEINNSLNIPYNITVNWFKEDKRYNGWKNVSTNWYNSSDITNYYYSNIKVYETGDWEVQVIIDYNIGNKDYSIDRIAYFKVI
ncbi:MAG: hypothetical protein WC867_00320 [Candidatus Pacearchaeota archaeon]|jgi:hypothetical protein